MRKYESCFRFRENGSNGEDCLGVEALTRTQCPQYEDLPHGRNTMRLIQLMALERTCAPKLAVRGKGTRDFDWPWAQQEGL